MTGELTTIRVLAKYPLPYTPEWGGQIAKKMGIQLVGTAAEALDILLAAREMAPDVVVMSSASHDIPGLVSILLGENPDLTVLLLLPENEIRIVQLHPVNFNAVNHSPYQFFSIMKSAVTKHGYWVKDD